MPKRNKVNNSNVVSSSPVGEDDPLTKELLDYENKNSPVGDKRNKATRIFLIVLLALIFALLVVLLLNSINSDEIRLVYTILSISLSALGIADLCWYIIYMVKTRKAFNEEKKNIDNYITNRIKEVMYEEHQREREEMLSNDIEKEKLYKKEEETQKIIDEDKSIDIDNTESN